MKEPEIRTGNRIYRDNERGYTDILNIRHRRIKEESAFLLANPSEPVRIVQENPCEPVITVFVYSISCVTDYFPWS